ncbi:hypothetical protein BS17DRAFT_783272 [Gyrodon lividus]|nr:hypothetical protein BS17DRAFT_783272 [Gyrodon lividus]
MPFSECNSCYIPGRVSRGERSPYPQNHALSEAHQNFIQRCWAASGERPTAEVASQFIQNERRSISDAGPGPEANAA